VSRFPVVVIVAVGVVLEEGVRLVLGVTAVDPPCMVFQCR
jgi:hypothetical protein